MCPWPCAVSVKALAAFWANKMGFTKGTPSRTRQENLVLSMSISATTDVETESPTPYARWLHFPLREDVVRLFRKLRRHVCVLCVRVKNNAILVFHYKYAMTLAFNWHIHQILRTKLMNDLKSDSDTYWTTSKLSKRIFVSENRCTEVYKTEVACENGFVVAVSFIKGKISVLGKNHIHNVRCAYDFTNN